MFRCITSLRSRFVFKPCRVFPLKFSLALLLPIFSVPILHAQTFTDMSGRLMPQNGSFMLSASAADINNDGWVDIYHPRRIYWNRSGESFEDVLLQTGIDEGTGACGAIFGDADNDGYLDVLLETSPPEDPGRLFRNVGGLAFKRVGPQANLTVSRAVMTCAWGDYNLDGLLDLFVGDDFGQNQLFKNLGDGTYQDIGESAGLHALGNSYGAGFGDYDNDGDPDIFIATCSFVAERSIKLLFRNNGDDTFTNVNVQASVNDSLASWGSIWLDYNNDGRMDIYVANIHGVDGVVEKRINKLYENNGDGTFTDVSAAAGVDGDEFEIAYNVAAADFNNDGWQDLYVATAASPNRLYRNRGDGTFIDVGPSAQVDEDLHTAVTTADFNNDGWVDIFLPGAPENKLFINDGGSNQWLEVRLRGRSANLFGIGAKVEAHAGDLHQYREITSGDSYCSQTHKLTAHFGLGGLTMVDSVVVRWPGGGVDRVENVAGDATITIVQGMGINNSPAGFGLTGPADGTMLGTPDDAVTFRWESATDDDSPNLTYRLRLYGAEIDTVLTAGNATELIVSADLFQQYQICRWTVDVSDGFSIVASRDLFTFGDAVCQPVRVFTVEAEANAFGPGLQPAGSSWGDFNNDGLVDLFVANRAGVNQLLQNPGNGSLQPVTNSPLMSEDSQFRSGAWGDIDNDGDADLFVTNRLGANLLFINEGGNLVKVNTGEIVRIQAPTYGCNWIDVNNDGFLDLFAANLDEPDFLFINDQAGGFNRVTDGPLVATSSTSLQGAWSDLDGDRDMDVYIVGIDSSALYINNGSGSFTAAGFSAGDIATVAVTGGFSPCWGDFDNDLDQDLLVIRTGGPNLLFENLGGGQFVQVTASVLVEGTRGGSGGSWADFDNDGTLDFFTSSGGRNILFRNLGNREFEAITTDVTAIGAASTCSWADYDRDGDLDLMLSVDAQSPTLFTNMGSDNNWLHISCEGTVSNRSAIGAKVFAKAMIQGQPTWQVREITGGSGYLSQSSLEATFGLGNATLVDTVRIEWPSGDVDISTDIPVNRVLTAVEGQGVTSVDAPRALPERFAARQNYPNPFNPETTISYLLPEASQVTIEIFNTQGQRVRKLLSANQLAGTHHLSWDGRDDKGIAMPSGLYFYRIKAGERADAKRMLLVR